MASVTGDGLVKLIGLKENDARVQQSLAEFAHGMEPELDPDDEDSLVDWVTVNELGLEYGFEDEAYVYALNPAKRQKGKLLLSQLYFYGDTAKTRPFPFPLPFGLRFEDGKRETRLKLAAYEDTRRSHVRDAWRLPDFDLTAAYRPDSGRLESLFCHIPYARWPPIQGEAELVEAFGPETFVSLFGKRWADATLRTELAPIGYERALPRIRSEHSVDLRLEHGLELAFAPGRSVAQASPQFPNALAFAGVVYYANRELDAREWAGELPCGMKFTDSRNDVREKIGRDPSQSEDEDRSGMTSWHFQEFKLSVLYSNIENRILRVMLLATEI